MRKRESIHNINLKKNKFITSKIYTQKEKVVILPILKQIKI